MCDVEEDLLPHPRFSTRSCSVLFVRIEVLLSESAPQPKPSPVRLLLDAFKLSSEGETFEHVELWNSLKTAANEVASTSSVTGAQDGPQFGRVFVDETIHLLASTSRNASSPIMSPTIEVASPVPRRSSPFSKILDRSKDKPAFGNGNGNSSTSPVSSVSSPIINDWAQFSTSGFGETSAATPLAATLLDTDKDLETTEPLASPKSAKKWGMSRSGQRSADSPYETSAKEPAVLSTKLASVHMAQVDEAFIDFWSDAIADPITANWPSFVICGLKPLPAKEAVNWLIVEQTYVRQQPPQPRPTSPERRGRTSPRPSLRSEISGTFAATRKRFSFLGGISKTGLTSKKSAIGKSPKVGELGEILPEEERSETPTAVTNTNKGLGIAGTATVDAVAAEAVQSPVPEEIVQSPAVAALAEQPQQELHEQALVQEAIVALAAIPDESVPESEGTLVEESASQSEPTHDSETPVFGTPENASLVETAQADLPEEPPVQPTQAVEPAPPAAESKPVEHTNGAASTEPPSSADA